MYETIAKRIHNPSITIVAVSKLQSIENIDRAWQQGARHFGENYLQEAEHKMTALADKDIVWHFIGAIQSNKTRKIASLFDWVQTVDRLNIADRLNRQRSIEQPPLNVCIQVNIDDESRKAGCSPEECIRLSRYILSLPGLRLRGIMIIPKPKPDTQQAITFDLAYDLFTKVQQYDSGIDTLSMGMSSDYMLAIEHGATMVRPGTAIFGAR